MCCPPPERLPQRGTISVEQLEVLPAPCGPRLSSASQVVPGTPPTSTSCIAIDTVLLGSQDSRSRRNGIASLVVASLVVISVAIAAPLSDSCMAGGAAWCVQHGAWLMKQERQGEAANPGPIQLVLDELVPHGLECMSGLFPTWNIEAATNQDGQVAARPTPPPGLVPLAKQKRRRYRRLQKLPCA